MMVAAGALTNRDAHWLMQRRPEEKHHGGLWEFPGGKVELSEMPAEALIRELREELAIAVRHGDCEPLTFAEDKESPDRQAIVILLYKVSAWQGTPRSVEGGRTGWFTLDEIAGLDKPPLDEKLLANLRAREER